MSVKSARDFEQEKAKANLPDLRMFIVQRDSQPELRADCKGRWWVCNADTVARFSATAYFFGRELHTGRRAPVGLINSSWPGTPIEAWTSVEAQSKIPGYAAVSEPWVKADAQRWDEAAAEAKYEEQRAQWTEAVRAAEAANKPAPRPPLKEIQPRLLPNHPANLYNAMIAPIIPFGIRGAIWYQGEANSAPAKAGFYQYQLPTLIEDWRARWGYDFPFAWVQLPNLDSSSASRDWPTVREAMLKTLQVRKTGMAVTIDIGDPRNIHPKNKQEVGRRLAFWALGSVYGEKVPAICGPLPAGHQIRGNEVVLSFDHTDGGLMARGGELKGFLIAGEDKKWVNTSAKFEGDKVIVSGPDVQRPVAVRYAWANNPDCNLYNGAGLPASPFRTDNWK